MDWNIQIIIVASTLYPCHWHLNTLNPKCATFKNIEDFKPWMCYFQLHKSEIWIFKRFVTDKKFLHSIKTRCRTWLMLRKGGRCTKGGGATSHGQIQSKGDKENPLLQEANNLTFQKHKKLAQWEPTLVIQTFIFVWVAKKNLSSSPKNIFSDVKLCKKLKIGY